jgi:hypothetical protein
MREGGAQNTYIDYAGIGCISNWFVSEIEFLELLKNLLDEWLVLWIIE